MSPTFFATDDGDVILRAGLEPDSKHDFRVHKLILSLASPLFKDMFTLPQPPDQTLSEEHQLPVVDIPEPPEVVDAILRLIYPGVEPQRTFSLSTLTTLLSAADKYNIASINPALKDALKISCGLLPFKVYTLACRFGFSEEAREAAKVGNTQSVTSGCFDEEVRHISSTDVFRWVRFVQDREREGRSKIGESLAWWAMYSLADCDHGEIGKDFYYRLERAVEKAFVENPCVSSKDLFAILDKVPDPPLGCAPDSESAEYHIEGPALDAFNCPVRPMSIRRKLAKLADKLSALNCRMLDETFGKGNA